MELGRYTRFAELSEQHATLLNFALVTPIPCFHDCSKILISITFEHAYLLSIKYIGVEYIGNHGQMSSIEGLLKM